jgi:hypothetical protein
MNGNSQNNGVCFKVNFYKITDSHKNLLWINDLLLYHNTLEFHNDNKDMICFLETIH